jgi:hypothetical protein
MLLMILLHIVLYKGSNNTDRSMNEFMLSKLKMKNEIAQATN